MTDPLTITLDDEQARTAAEAKGVPHLYRIERRLLDAVDHGGDLTAGCSPPSGPIPTRWIGDIP